MQKRNLFLILSFVILGSQFLWAQKLTWNPALKMDDSFHQTPVGIIDDSYYLVTGNYTYTWGRFTNTPDAGKLKLVKYNNKLDAVVEKYLDLRKEMSEFVDAYVYKDQIHIIYFNEETLVKKVLDKNMNEVGSFTSSVKDRKRKGFAGDARYSYLLADDHRQIAICINKTVEILDEQLKSVGITEASAMTDRISPVWYKNNFYFVALDDEVQARTTVYQYDLTSKKLNSILEDIPGQWGSSLFINKADQKLHYLSLQGDKENVDKKGNPKEKLAAKVYHSIYSPSLIKEKSEEISLEQYKEKKKIGVNNAAIKNVFFNTTDITIVLSPSYRDVNMTGYHYNDLYFIKLTDQGPVHHREPLFTFAQNNYEYLGQSIVVSMNNQFVMIFQEGGSRYDLRKVVLDNNLKPVSSETIPIYKTYGFYLATDEYLRVADNKYLIWGRYQNKVGSVFIE